MVARDVEEMDRILIGQEPYSNYHQGESSQLQPQTQTRMKNVYKNVKILILINCTAQRHRLIGL